MSFFLDNTFPRRLARMLGAMDVDVRHLQEVEELTPDTPDTDWMPVVAEQGWTVVTADGRILTRPHEKELWRSLEITIFILHKGYSKLPLWDQAVFLLKHWPKIDKRARRATAGAPFKVTAHGKIEGIEVK